MAETNLKKNKDGYGYKYTDLAQIHEYLESVDTTYYQYVDTADNGKDYIMTVPIVKGVEQKPRRGVQIVDAVLNGIKNPAQEQGSATTYARRYSLLMAFGLATEDDDGASLTKPDNVPNKQIKNVKKIPEITTKEQAEQYKLTFGKNAGKTLKEIIETDTNYANWLYQNTKDETVKKCLNLIIASKKGTSAQVIEQASAPAIKEAPTSITEQANFDDFQPSFPDEEIDLGLPV